MYSTIVCTCMRASHCSLLVRASMIWLTTVWLLTQQQRLCCIIQGNRKACNSLVRMKLKTWIEIILVLYCSIYLKVLSTTCSVTEHCHFSSLTDILKLLCVSLVWINTAISELQDGAWIMRMHGEEGWGRCNLNECTYILHAPWSSWCILKGKLGYAVVTSMSPVQKLSPKVRSTELFK